MGQIRKTLVERIFIYSAQIQKRHTNICFILKFPNIRSHETVAVYIWVARVSIDSGKSNKKETNNFYPLTRLDGVSVRRIPGTTWTVVAAKFSNKEI